MQVRFPLSPNNTRSATTGEQKTGGCDGVVTGVRSVSGRVSP
jgi:hypothetical protein